MVSFNISFELNGEIISIRKTDQLLINLVLDSKAKKISFHKVEEKENSIPTLIQKGDLDDIKNLLENDPSGWALLFVFSNIA